MIRIERIWLKRIQIMSWVCDNSIEARYDWPFTNITFYNDEDATAFMLKFGGERVKTRLERMIEEENEKSPD